MRSRNKPHRPADRQGGIRGEIDGLRAVAVALVLAYHAKFGFTGGFVGVDVFFVISGFLVTGMLLREYETTFTIEYAQFWGRRVRRLLVPVSVVSVATIAVGYFVLEPFRLRGLAYDAFAAATMNANNRYAFTNSDYLSGLNLPSPLLHLWSLGVEEQYYLLLPVLFAIAIRYWNERRALGILLGVIGGASFAASIILVERSPSFAYFLLPTRAWELVAGSMLALIAGAVTKAPLVVRACSGWVGLAAILYASLVFNERTSFPGVAAIVPVFGALGVIIGGMTGPGRLLACGPLQWVGTRSYSLYLWHWPVLVLAEAAFGTLSVYQRMAALGCSLALADGTFRLLEQPFRFHPALLSSLPNTFRAGTALTMSVVCAASVLVAVAPARSGVTGVVYDANAGAVSDVPSTSADVPMTDSPVTDSPMTIDPEADTTPTSPADAVGSPVQDPVATPDITTPTGPATGPAPSVKPAPSASSPVVPSSKAKAPGAALPSAQPGSPGVSTGSTSQRPTPLATKASGPVGKVLLIGDSTLAPLRWYRQGEASLQGFTYRIEAESCRRLAYKSCRGREDRTPSSAVPVIEQLTRRGQLFQTVVVMGGYHSTTSTIGPEFDALVKAIREHGATRIVFVEYRESLAYPAPGSKGELSVYTTFNKTLRKRLASGRYDDVTLLPWNTYTAQASSWFRSDGIHVNLEGTLALGAYLSDALASLEERPCVTDSAVTPCVIPDEPADDDVDLYEMYGVKPTDTHCYEMGPKRTPRCMRDLKM